MSFSLLVSWIFEPMFVLFVLCLLAGRRYGLNGSYAGIYDAYVSILTIVIGALRYGMAKRAKTNWDLSDRKKRIVPLFVLAGVFLANYVIISVFGSDDLRRYFGLWLASIVGFSVLTTRIKISGHMAVLTMAVATMIAWYGVWAVPAVLIIPLVSWSRITLGRHTLIEVVGGFVFAVLMVLLGNVWAVW